MGQSGGWSELDVKILPKGSVFPFVTDPAVPVVDVDTTLIVSRWSVT